MVSSSSIAISASALACAIALSSVNAAPMEKRSNPKRGVAWNYLENVSADIFSAQSSWTYSYEHFQPHDINVQNMEWVIMQKDGSDSGSSPISQLASAAANSQYVLGFNEPDLNNVSPQDAANTWKTWIQPLKAQGKKLVAPAITSSTNQGQGLSWLDQFVAACDGCTFDAYAFHPYAANANDIINSAKAVIDYQGGKYGNTGFWITEFGRDQNNWATAGGADMIRQVTSAFDQIPQIQRYAYIGKIAGSFVDQRDLQVDENSTQMTELGVAYNS